MNGHATPHPNLPKAPPLVGGRVAPLLVRLLKRPWPLVDVLVVKTRTCPLCDEAWRVLRERRRSLGLNLRAADISNRPSLLEAYGHEVPVVFVAGKRRFFGRVDPVLLAREVSAARERRVGSDPS
jgi:hypothetical protein